MRTMIQSHAQTSNMQKYRTKPVTMGEEAPPPMFFENFKELLRNVFSPPPP